MKLTKKQVDIIKLYTPNELHGQPVKGWTGYELGYYQPAGANWAYSVKGDAIMAAGFYIAIMPGILAIMAGAAWFTDHFILL